MKIYVATSLERASYATAVMQALRKLGHVITYDWTQHGSVQAQGDLAIGVVAAHEANGVIEADLFVALLPGGRGTHTELGLALADAMRRWATNDPPKQVHLVGPQVQDDRICSFYRHPLITAHHHTAEAFLASLGSFDT